MSINTQLPLAEERRKIADSVHKITPGSLNWDQLKKLNHEMDELARGVNNEAETRYQQVFRKFLLFDKILLNDAELRILKEREDRDLQSGAGAYPGSGSGFFAPVQFVSELWMMLKQVDRLFDSDVVTIIPTPRGGPASIPNLDDTSSEATLVTQGSQDVTEEPLLGQLSFGTCPTWRSGIPRVSIEFDRDSAFSFDTLLARSFARRFSKGIGKANVATLLSAATLGVTAAGSASNTGGNETGSSSVGTDDLYNLMGCVNEEYIASPKCYWAMRFTTLLSLWKIKNKQGSPVIKQMFNDRGEPMLFGKPVAFCPNMPAIGSGNKCIAFGDFGRFVIRTVEGDIRVQRYGERWAEYGIVGFGCFMRAQAGLQVTNPVQPPSPPTSNTPICYLQNA